MSERVCVIHVGTHKTGTTAVQNFMRTNLETFERGGLLFARTGWYGVVPGHHQVAWDLRYGKFDEQVAALVAELRGSEAPHAVLSAEDFSLLHAQPETLAHFAAMLRDAGYTPKVLVYLREQGGFAESMYAERVKHGTVRPFPEYCDRILTTGTYDVYGAPLQFDYPRLLDAFAAVVGAENLAARAYVRSPNDIDIFHDFLSGIASLAPGFVPNAFSLEVHHPRVNESLTFGALLGYAFLHTHPQEGLPNDPAPFFSRWAPEASPATLNARFMLLTDDEIRRFADRFASANEELRARFGVALPRAQPRSGSAREIAELQRAIFDRCIEEWVTRSAASQPRSE